LFNNLKQVEQIANSLYAMTAEEIVVSLKSSLKLNLLVYHGCIYVDSFICVNQCLSDIKVF